MHLIAASLAEQLRNRARMYAARRQNLDPRAGVIDQIGD
jgi:hypothetical protein